MSIADCITPLISPIQSIDTLIARDSNVNIGGDTVGELEKAWEGFKS